MMTRVKSTEEMTDKVERNLGDLQLFSENLGAKNLTEMLQFPKFFSIETVSICNARCTMCPVEDWERDARLMEDETFDNIVAQLKPWAHWIERVTPQLNGEPLIDKKFEERIAKLKAIGIKEVAFNSNGSLMTKDRAEKVVESGVDDVAFSMDGATKDTYDAIRRRLKFEEVVENIENFIKVRDAKRPELRIRIRFTVQKNNRHEYEKFVNFWHARLKKDDVVVGKEVVNWGNQFEVDVPNLEDSEFVNSSACISPFGTLCILSDGRVPLCCVDFNAKVDFGNVNKYSIEDIWKSVAIKNMRETHIQNGRGSVELCENCTVWDPRYKKDFQKSSELD